MGQCDECLNYINGECQLGDNGYQTEMYERYEPAEVFEEGR